MQLDKLIPLLKGSISNITELWVNEVKATDHLLTYNALSDEDLFARGERLFHKLVWWLEAGANSNKAEEYFNEVGLERFKERFPLTEVLYAFYLNKKVIWNCDTWKDHITNTIGNDKYFDFSQMLNNYFDLGNYNVTRGYFNQFLKRIDEEEGISIEDVKKILTNRKPQSVDFDLDEIIWRHV